MPACPCLPASHWPAPPPTRPPAVGAGRLGGGGGGAIIDELSQKPIVLLLLVACRAAKAGHSIQRCWAEPLRFGWPPALRALGCACTPVGRLASGASQTSQPHNLLTCSLNSPGPHPRRRHQTAQPRHRRMPQPSAAPPPAAACAPARPAAAPAAAAGQRGRRLLLRLLRPGLQGPGRRPCLPHHCRHRPAAGGAGWHRHPAAAAAAAGAAGWRGWHRCRQLRLPQPLPLAAIPASGCQQ